MSDENRRIVQPRSDGKWESVKPHHKRASVVGDTQKDVIDKTRPIIRNAGGGELQIKGRDGLIRDSDTVRPGNEGRGRDTK